MSQTTFSVRMDDGLKQEFDALCSEFGMSMSTAINVFARTVVRERKIPFEITANKPDTSMKKARNAFYSLRQQAKTNGVSGMSLDEINEEIRLAREAMENRQ